MLTFSYVPEFGAQKNQRPNAKPVRFAEGYEQRISFGMNTTPQVWSLQFANRSEADGDAIDAFLKARAAVEAFLWTPPDSDDAIVVVCREWTKVISNGSYRGVSATFEQVFEV